MEEICVDLLEFQCDTTEWLGKWLEGKSLWDATSKLLHHCFGAWGNICEPRNVMRGDVRNCEDISPFLKAFCSQPCQFLGYQILREISFHVSDY